MTITDQPVFVEATRSDRREALHQVHVVACDSSGKIIGQYGDPGIETYERSLAKPLQLLTVMKLRPSLLDECSHEEIAIMAASHSGEAKHIETINGLLKRYDLKEDSLLCGTHPPFLQKANWELGRKNIETGPVYHNCSGKHIGMLLASREMGWTFDGYNRIDHPIQVANRVTMARYAGVEPDDLEFGSDGCGVPTWWLSLQEIASASARFGDPGFGEDDFEIKFKDKIFESYHKASWWTAGTNRFGDPFNRESDGKWLGKIGGEAVFGVSFKDRSIGIGIKVLDGNNRVLGPALLYAMKQWDLITDDQLSRLSDWTQVIRKNAPGWDIGFVRVVDG
jgi:L-asparaginase II